jgi:L-threonylcarbamoyladenylate synthase
MRLSGDADVRRERAALRLDATVPGDIEQVAQVIMAGGVVALPTDTVYGVAASLAQPMALQRIYRIKGRPDEKPLPVLLAAADDLAHVAQDLPAALLALADRFWPGALTIVVPARADLPIEVTTIDVAGGPTVGVRAPDHPAAIDVIARAGGAIAVTSANRSGQPAATTADEVAAALGSDCDAILDAGPSPGGIPSTVVAVKGGRLIVLREGAIAAARLAAAWREIAGSAATSDRDRPWA